MVSRFMLSLAVAFLPLACTWAADRFVPIEIEYLWQSQTKLGYDWTGRPVIPNIEVTAQHINAARPRAHSSRAERLASSL